MRSSSTCSGSDASDGHTWNPRHPIFTAQTTWARSSITRASDVVPFGVVTMVVASQSGRDLGTRFWKKLPPPTPSGKRCMSTGRPPMARMAASSTDR